MTDVPNQELGPLRRWWSRLVKNWGSGWIGELPDEMAACELNCRELECDALRWEECENRLQMMAEIKAQRLKVAQCGELSRPMGPPDIRAGADASAGEA